MRNVTLLGALVVVVLTHRPAVARQDKSDWDARIAQANGAGWREQFGLGQELAGAAGDGAFNALKKAWPSLNVQAKQQILKAWHFATPAPFSVRYHPKAFDVLALALDDKGSGEVAAWARDFLPAYSWRTFDTTDDAKNWVGNQLGGKPTKAATESMETWVGIVRGTGRPSTAATMMNMLPSIGYPLRRNPWLVEDAKKAGMQAVLEAAIENPDVSYNALVYAYGLLSELDTAKYPPDGTKAFLERFKDREARQGAADREKMLKGLDVRRVDGDERKQWILFPPLGQTQPDKGWGLLVVLPGGDGSVDFAPFVGGSIRAAAGLDYIVVEMVAPPLPANEAEKNRAIVWPREALKDARVDFTMEPVIRAAVEAVKKERKIDVDRSWVMGWSSGGPPSYTMAVEEKGAFKGALVAMSVFHEGEYPSLAGASGRGFYLLHSPTDFIPMKQPEGAKGALEKAGARVKLVTYEGGHGWHGDINKMVGDAIRWLEGKGDK